MTLASDPPHASPSAARSDGVWQRLALTVVFRGPECTLILVGSLDADSAIALESQFDQLVMSRLEGVVLDVNGLHRVDQAGTESLARLDELLRRQGVDVSLSGEMGTTP